MKFFNKILVLFDEAQEKFIWNLIIIVLFTLIYWLEFKYGDEEQELSIADAFYFTTITHFTIGYGDISLNQN